MDIVTYIKPLVDKRLQLNISQIDMAARIGCTPGGLCKFEKGLNNNLKWYLSYKEVIENAET